MKYDIDENEILFSDGLKLICTGYDFVASSRESGSVNLSELRQAVRRWQRDFGLPGSPCEVNLTYSTEVAITRDLHFSGPGTIRFLEGKTELLCDFLVGDVIHIDSVRAVVERVSQRRNGVNLLSTDTRLNDIDEGQIVQFRFGGSFRGWSFRDVVDWVESIESMVTSMDSGKFDANCLRDCLDCGNFMALEGMPECNWLEVKSQPYPIDQHGFLELAKDLSSLANGAVDSILIIGAKTLKIGGKDVVTKISPMDRSLLPLRKWQQAISSKIYPPMSNVMFKVVESLEGALAYVYVPRQPAALQPFIVKDPIVAGKTRGTLIAIWRREDDECEAFSPQEIHGWLVAAKAYLAGTNAIANGPKLTG